MRKFRAKGNFKIVLNVNTEKVKKIDMKFPKLTIESGVFNDTRHYSKNITAQNLYSVLLYGTQDGRIPSRNVLDFLNNYVEKNKEKYIKDYLENKDSEIITDIGIKIGTDINNQHKKLIYNFISPSNAPSTIKQKGKNDPLVDTGTLVKSIAFSINGKGRWGKG